MFSQIQEVCIDYIQLLFFHFFHGSSVVGQSKYLKGILKIQSSAFQN
jgi:hypothetical protein